jgi:hypothetical protein
MEFIPFDDVVYVAEGDSFTLIVTCPPWTLILRELVSVSLITPQRLLAPKLDVALIDVSCAHPIEQCIVRRTEPLFTWLIGMNGKVITVTFIGTVMSASGCPEKLLEKPNTRG